MSNYYGTLDEVKQYTGVKYTDLNFSSDELYNTWLENRLIEIKDLIDQDRHRDYHAEVENGTRSVIPPGINHIALRMMANLLAQAVLRRETPVVKIDDFSIKMVEDQVFTSAIKKDLMRYPAKTLFRITRIDTSDDEEDEIFV
ncbi:MAG: hypothetical protein WDA47_05760 [Bacilli bacterium]